MNIVVTKNKVDYLHNFIKVSTLEEAYGIRGTIDYLIYNSSNENTESKIKYLGLLKERAKKLVYICNEKNCDMAIKMMIVGSEGKYVEDEFYLEGSEELEGLLHSLEEITALVEMGGVNVLTDFFNRFLQNGNSNFTPVYLGEVKKAVSVLMSEYNEKNAEIIQMSETASEIFSNTVPLLDKMGKEIKSLQEKSQKVMSSIQENSPIKRTSSVLFFPRIPYLHEKSIIRVKDIGGFRYLTSFMLGFKNYLKLEKMLRPKLIFIEPVGENIEKRYEEYSWVTKESIRSSSNYFHDVVFTNNPSRDVIFKLLEDNDYDTFIVVDRTTSEKEHILNSKRGNVKYAVSGLSIINKFKLPIKDCFSCISEIPNTLFTVPVYVDYPSKKTDRERHYLNELKIPYEKLILDLRRR